MNLSLHTFKQKYEASIQDKGGSIRRGFMALSGCNDAIEYLIAQGVTINIADAQPMYVKIVQHHLDTVAQERGYDNILSLCSYATSSDMTHSAEGQAGVEWRDAVWNYCFSVLGEVTNELRTLPTPDELIAELPTITW